MWMRVLPSRCRPSARRDFHSTRAFSCARIIGCGNDPFDELGLGARVRLARFGIGSDEPRCQLLLQSCVLASGVGMLAQIVAERERAPLFFAARGNHMHMVRVRPLCRPMKKRTERI